MAVRFIKNHAGPGTYIAAGTITSLEDWQEQSAVKRGDAIPWDAAAAKAEAREAADRAAAAEAEAARARQAEYDRLAQAVGPNPVLLLRPVFAPGRFLPAGTIFTPPQAERDELIQGGFAAPLSVDDAVQTLLADGDAGKSESELWRVQQNRVQRHLAALADA